MLKNKFESSQAFLSENKQKTFIYTIDTGFRMWILKAAFVPDVQSFCCQNFVLILVPQKKSRTNEHSNKGINESITPAKNLWSGAENFMPIRRVLMHF